MEQLLEFAQQQAFLVAVLLVLIFAFLRRESSTAGSKLTINQVVQALNSDSAVLLDVRESKDFKAGHIVNAINIAHAKIEGKISELEQYREKQIIVTDEMGSHAATVSRLLAKKEFNVARMTGGMSEWRQEGLPVAKS